ncbi:MAG: hypothetical protein ACKVOQ_07215 [Cyclobacteriaceae bacterium]
MKKYFILFFFSALLGCSEKVEPLGGLEMAVTKVVSVNGIPYEEIEIGIFPTESLVTKDYSKTGAIAYQKLVNGKVRFENILPATYNVGVIVTAYPQPGSYKLVQIKPGQLVTVELLK